MSGKVVIRARALGKAFPIYSGGAGRLLSALTLGRAARAREYWALRELSFAIERGEAVGVIGQNGSGKSTLLKLLAGLTRPSEGELEVDGKIGSLIELGTGFNPEFTGRENVRLNAALLGIPPAVLEEKFPEIEKFAGIGEFIDRPVKTYSSGMYVRLGFSVTLALDPEILLVDEALAVGDLLFQQKCFARLKRLRETGVTLVLVTHDLAAVKNFCDRAALLDGGRMVASGATGEVVDEYNAILQRRALEGTDREIVSVAAPAAGRKRHGSFEAVITGIELRDGHGETAAALAAGSPGVIRVTAALLETVRDPVVGILIRDRLTNHIFGTNTALHHIAPGEFLQGEALVAEFRMDFDLGPGEYSVTAAVHTESATYDRVFDWADDLLAFKILPTEPGFIGCARLKPVVTLEAAKGGGGASALDRLFADAPGEILTGDSGHRKFLIRGFFPAENDDQGAFRWTGPEAAFVMRLDGESLEFDALCVVPEGEAVTVALQAGVEPPVEVALASGGWQRLCFILPPRSPGGIRRCTLRTTPPFAPGGGDSRVLGLAIRTIRCTGGGIMTAGGGATPVGAESP